MKSVSMLSEVFAGVALVGALILANGQQVRADDCQRWIARADHNLHEAIDHRGYESEAAEHARHELREARGDKKAVQAQQQEPNIPQQDVISDLRGCHFAMAWPGSPISRSKSLVPMLK